MRITYIISIYQKILKFISKCNWSKTSYVKV